MSGTKAGGKLAAKANKEKYGKDFYAKIGRIGGSVDTPKGFSISGKARSAGSKGGKRSKRGHKLIKETEEAFVYSRNSDGKHVTFWKF